MDVDSLTFISHCFIVITNPLVLRQPLSLNFHPISPLFGVFEIEVLRRKWRSYAKGRLMTRAYTAQKIGHGHSESPVKASNETHMEL